MVRYKIQTFCGNTKILASVSPQKQIEFVPKVSVDFTYLMEPKIVQIMLIFAKNTLIRVFSWNEYLSNCIGIFKD